MHVQANKGTKLQTQKGSIVGYLWRNAWDPGVLHQGPSMDRPLEGGGSPKGPRFEVAYAGTKG